MQQMALRSTIPRKEFAGRPKLSESIRGLTVFHRSWSLKGMFPIELRYPDRTQRVHIRYDYAQSQHWDIRTKRRARKEQTQSVADLRAPISIALHHTLS